MHFGVQFGSLPAPQMILTGAEKGIPERPRHSSFRTAESLNTKITVRVNPLNGEQTEDESPKSPSLIERGKLKRVANSFCVQVPASEFVMNPVRSLFSSFIVSENESCSNNNNASGAQYDCFVSGWQDLSADNLNITMINDDDDLPRQHRNQLAQSFGNHD